MSKIKDSAIGAAIKSKEAEALATRQQTIDAFTEMHLSLESKIKEYEKLKKVVAGYAAENMSEDEIRLDGVHSFVWFTAPSTNLECKLNPLEVLEKAGGDISVLSVSVTACKKVFNQSDMDAVFDKVRGSRRFKHAIKL